MMKPPDTQLVAITHADDSVTVLAFVTAEYDPNGEARWSRLATRENVDAEIAKCVEVWEQAAEFEERLPVKRWKFVERVELPEDRTYRDALRHSPAEGFFFDLPRAREIHRGYLRLARERAWITLDAKFSRALESGDEAALAEAAAKRQAMRDLPADPAIEKAKTVEELKEVWPDDLPRV